MELGARSKGASGINTAKHFAINSATKAKGTGFVAVTNKHPSGQS